MTKDAQIEKEETLKKVLSGDLDDSFNGSMQYSALLNQLCEQVNFFSICKFEIASGTLKTSNAVFTFCCM